MFNIKNYARKSLLLLLAAGLIAFSSSCTDKTLHNHSHEGNEGEDAPEIHLPENENKKQEIIVNDNYADSELFDFQGTIDEIYEDGSMLVYSPTFGVNFNYMVIVEKDATTKEPDFEPKVNQQVEFNVYSAVKRSEPLTVVAVEMKLVSEESTQRAEEAERKAKVQEALEKHLKGE